jgi:hypothetical protein
VVDNNNTNTCYLCGLRPAETKDHLFPRALFSRPLPSNLPIGLPACRQCNNELSKYEEQFRFFLASGMAYESETGRHIWDERIRSALKGRRPGFKALARSMVKVAKIQSESGTMLGDWPAPEGAESPEVCIDAVPRKATAPRGDGRVLPPGFQLLEVENKMSYLLNTNAGNIGRKSGCLQEFPEKVESGEVEIDSTGALAFGPGTEPVTPD